VSRSSLDSVPLVAAEGRDGATTMDSPRSTNGRYEVESTVRHDEQPISRSRVRNRLKQGVEQRLGGLRAVAAGAFQSRRELVDLSLDDAPRLERDERGAATADHQAVRPRLGQDVLEYDFIGRDLLLHSLN